MENIQCLIKAHRVDKTKRGEPYVVMKLKSMSDEFEAKIWSAPACAQDLKVGEVISVEGDWDSYLDTKYLNVKDYDDVKGADVSQFVDKYPPEKYEWYKAQFKELRGAVEDPELVALMDYLLPDSFCENYYFTVPAASQFHHTEWGDLLAHSVETALICQSLFRSIPIEVKTDLLIAGGLLHDIGKCYTYEFKDGLPTLRNEEYLHGHSAKGVELIGIAEFSLQKNYSAIKHLVASHQGAGNWGSITTPSTMEAQILHSADYLSSRLYMFETAKYEDGRAWSNSMKQYIFE